MNTIYIVQCDDAEQILQLIIAAGVCGYGSIGDAPLNGERLFFDTENKLFSAEPSAKEEAVRKAEAVTYDGMIEVLMRQAKERKARSGELNEKNLHEPNIEIGFEDHDGNRGIYSLCVPCAIKALRGDDEALNIIFGDDRTKRMMLAYLLCGEGFITSQDWSLETGQAVH